MVKFAKYLDCHLVPEWRPAFCNYKKLKKALKEITSRRNVECRVYEGAPYLALRGPSLKQIQSRSRANVILVHRTTSELYDSGLDLVETEMLVTSAQAESEKAFFERLDAELNKVNEFYKTKEQEFLQHADILDKQMEALFELKLVVGGTRNFGNSPQFRSTTNDDLSIPLKSENLTDMMDSVVSLHNEMLFQTISNQNTMPRSGLPNHDQLSSIREQLGDINSKSTSQASHRYQGRNINGKDLKDGRESPLNSIGVSRSLSEDISCKTTRSPGESKRSNSGEFHAFRTKVKHSEKMLCEAFIEFYRGLDLLKSYSSLNSLAFTKILKKYEKVTERGASSTYMETVDKSYFQTSDKVAKLIIWLESMFTDYFANGDRIRAKKTLRPAQAKASLRITFFLGMFSGCSLVLAVAFGAVLHVLFANMTDLEQAAWTAGYMNSIFPIFSMIALLLLHMYMYGWNLYLWRRTRINYAFIFEFAPGTELCYRKVLLVCTGLTVVLGGGMLGHLAAHYSQSVLIDLIPLGVVLTIFGLLLCPFDICYQSSRKFFLNCIFRIICAPLYQVLLADFFIGDQLCSQVPLLRNLEYIVCYYAGGHFKTENGDACLNNQRFKQISYMISLLPYWWRFMQCLRRYQDEKSRSHLANGGKYVSAMIVLCVRDQYGRTDTTSWMVLYIISSTFAAIYQIYWDLVIDWGLLRRNAANPWLRDKLVLENRRYIYFVSMGVNVILRFPWLLSVTHFQFGGLDTHITDFLLAALEIMRRAHWNFYRLENEHLYNVGHYRAIKTVPLPFVNN